MLPNLVDTQFKARHIFTILVEFLLLVDLKQLFWVVNFLIHLLFFRQEILSGFIAKILIMGRSIWLILPPSILITLACTFLVDKVRGTRTLSRLHYRTLFNKYILTRWMSAMSPEYSKDRSITDVHFMDQNYNWSKLVQSMMSGRMGHASIYDGTGSRCLFSLTSPKYQFYWSMVSVLV